MTTSPSKNSQGWGQGKRPGLGSEGVQAAVSAEHPGIKGRAGVCRRRGEGGLLTSGCECCRSAPDSDRGDSCSAGATASPPGCLLCSSSMPAVALRRELLEPDTRSLSVGQTPNPRFSPWKKSPAPVPAEASTQIERRPPTSGSVWRLHAAQARWAGARGMRGHGRGRPKERAGRAAERWA